jgi:predicted HTH domain antitoxin
MMTTLAIELPEEIFSSLKRTPKDFLLQMRLASAIHWYARGEISQEKAALIAGLDRVDFLAALAREEIEVFSVDIASLEQELNDD